MERRILSGAILALGLTVSSCEYPRVLRPSVLGQLDLTASAAGSSAS